MDLSPTRDYGVQNQYPARTPLWTHTKQTARRTEASFTFLVTLLTNECIRRDAAEASATAVPSVCDYCASWPGWIPSPSTNVAPTAPTTADLRDNFRRSRMAYTVLMPVQCAPTKYCTPKSLNLSAVQSTVSSEAEKRW